MLFSLVFACATETDSGGDEEALAPTLQNVQAEVFNSSCAFSGCHQGAGSSGNLALEDGAAFANLVGIASDGVPTATRVVPADPDASYLILKLEAGEGIVGDQMPSAPLDAERIQLVRDWIAQGAQDN